MLTKRKINVLILCGLAVTCIFSGYCEIAHATPIWDTSALSELTGSRDSSLGGGVTASADWVDGNFAISWIVTQDLQTNLWTYKYTLTATKDPSHSIIEVTEDLEKPFQYEDGTSPLDGVKTFVPGEPSNPGLPYAIYGAKHNYEDELDTTVTTIITLHPPVWGVFYSKDGKTDKVAVTAWADALNFSNYKTSETLSITDYIVRPNGLDTPVPEPATLSLLLLGGLTMVARRRRRS